jgi:hypothetical protein
MLGVLREPADQDTVVLQISSASASISGEEIVDLRRCDPAVTYERSSGGAHQFHFPSNAIAAGNNTVRMTIASTKTARVSPTPAMRIIDTCDAIKAANEIAMINAAAVTMRAVLARPSATASSLAARV